LPPSIEDAGKLASMMKLWDRVEQTISGLLGLAALALALWQVVSRYLSPQHAIGCAEEVIVYLVIWAILIVSSQLVRTDSHVRPDLVLNLVGESAKRWMEVSNSLTAIVFCVAVTWYGWEVTSVAWLIDERSASDLRFPMWVYYASLPAGGFLMSVRYVIRLGTLLATPAWRAMLPQPPGSHELPRIH
jgi:C4-dicarboxylate transporter DctQ subunit